MRRKIIINNTEFESINSAARHFKINEGKFLGRYQRGFRGKKLIYTGNYPTSGNKKSLQQVKNECIEKLKKFEKKKNIKKIEDWYKIPFRQINKVIWAYLKRNHIPADKWLSTIYPKYDFLPWLFTTNPKNIWMQKKNRVNYIKWLRKRLKIKNLSEFYKIKHNDILYNHYGSVLGGTKKSKKKINKRRSMFVLLNEAYPKYRWKFWLFSQAPTKIWLELKNQKEFFNWILKKEKIDSSTDDIYKISFSTIRKYGGSRLSTIYPRFFDFMEKMLPFRKIDRFKFDNKGTNFWLNKEHRIEGLLYLGKKLGFKKRDDWYAIKYDDFENNGFHTILSYYNYSPSTVVIKLLQEYKFDKTKFDFSSKYEFRARCYSKCLFGYNNIFPNAKIDLFLRKKTNRKLELDIWIPKFKIAIEYQGEQHYKKGFQTLKAFKELKKRDAEKKEIAKLNGINLIELKWKKWNGLPETFIDQVNKSYKLKKSQKDLFWKRFKKDDLYKGITKEKKNITTKFR